MVTKRLILALMVIAPAARCYAVDTMTRVNNDYVKTLRVHPVGDPLGLPVIVSDRDAIEVSFDHLAEDREFFRYRLTHCDANWQPSQLVESEYLDGFNEAAIEDYGYSEGTTVHYVHYQLQIPNEQMRPTLSGNYLLTVYPESEPDSTVLQCRFMISEQSAPIELDVTVATDVDYRRRHQQLEVSVDTERAEVEDAFNDMIVVVGQNGRFDNEVAFRQPLRMLGKTAVFEHRPELIFEAGNEYRRFETVSDYYPGMNVGDIEYFEPYYHYTLGVDEERAELPYSFDVTQNGRYMVRRLNANDSDVEADYGVVHFELAIPEMPGHLIFLDGDFTNRQFDANARMTYDRTTGTYRRAMLLKQGSYNYQYLVVPPGGRRGYTQYVEGDKYNTVNEYFVRVYHRRRGERYDRLIGVGVIRTDNTGI